MSGAFLMILAGIGLIVFSFTALLLNQDPNAPTEHVVHLYDWDDDDDVLPVFGGG